MPGAYAEQARFQADRGIGPDGAGLRLRWGLGCRTGVDTPAAEKKLEP